MSDSSAQKEVVFLFSSEFFSVGLRSVSCIFLENLGKVRYIVKGQVVGYFFGTSLGGGQQIFGLLDFQFLNVAVSYTHLTLPTN